MFNYEDLILAGIAGLAPGFVLGHWLAKSYWIARLERERKMWEWECKIKDEIIKT